METKLIDGHMHLEYGPLSKEYVLEFVDAAHKKGISEIQILDHTHRFKEFEKMYEPLKKIEVQKNWLENKEMKFHNTLDEYTEVMEEVKKMDLPVKVKYGLEVCYTEDSEELIRNVLKKYNFDFVVGSVHSIDGILYDMPFSKELLWERYDTDEIYRHYYIRIMHLVDSGLFTQLGHPDTVKMFDYYPTYELIETYNALADKLIEKKMKAENNVRCHYKYHHNDLGLSDELLKVFKEKGVEIITCSDGHHPEEVGLFIKEADERIRKVKI